MVAGAPVTETEEVRKFQDARWVGGTWDLKKFEKDGKVHWDSVIDAGEIRVLYIISNLIHFYDQVEVTKSSNIYFLANFKLCSWLLVLINSTCLTYYPVRPSSRKYSII